MAQIRSEFDSAENQMFLENCQSTCFICVQHLSSQNVQNVNCAREHSIRTVFRHLKINQIVQIDSKDNFPSDVMLFCDRCYQVFASLSNYCADLEILKMRIRYFLNQLKKLIVVEETNPSFRTIDKARKHFKTKLGEKCSPNNQTNPIVLLPQLEVQQIRALKYQTNNNSASLSDDEHKPEGNHEMTEISDYQYYSCDVEHESYTISNSQNKFIKPKMSHSTTNSNERNINASSSKRTYTCFECKCNFKRKISLLEHSPLFHPEKHFPSNSKSDDLTIPQHKMYLTHLLNNEVDSCGSWKSGYNCLYCSKVFQKRGRLSLRLHLINDHQEKLLKNLDQLQKDVSPELITKTVKMPIRSHQKADVSEERIKLKQFCKTKNRMKLEYICSICQVCTTSLRQHEALHHPEKFLCLKRSKDISSDQLKIYCAYLINKHLKNFTIIQRNRKVRFQCPHCQNSYIDLQTCRNHLVLSHAGLLSVEIENLQRTTKPTELNIFEAWKRSESKNVKSITNPIKMNTMACKVCAVRLTQRGMTIHMRKSHPIEYSKTYSCEVCIFCKEKFRYRWCLNFHKTRFHADVLFAKFKSSETTVDQFKGHFENMIKEEIRGLEQIKTTNGNTRYRCSCCCTTFSDTKYVRIHLVMKHNEILGGKLQELQQNEIDYKGEQDVVIKREESGENFEEDNDFEATEVFCAKSVTKQESVATTYENEDENVELEGYEDLNETS